MKPYDLSVFIFRRDLRLEDNTALHAALASSEKILPCFILDPRQVGDNPFKSDHAVQFMAESLRQLQGALHKRGGRLFVFSGRPEDVLERLMVRHKISAVFVNRDYTPFSVTRDLALRKYCRSSGVAFEAFDDALLNAPGVVLKDAGGPYTVFTPFFRKASQNEIAKPAGLERGHFFDGDIPEDDPFALERVCEGHNDRIALQGGRSEALGILKRLKTFSDYARQRDIPSAAGTTRLSAHLKFGTVSAREVYHAVKDALGLAHPLIRQLFWRDFFTTIIHHFPHVLGHFFYEEYDTIPWENDRRLFKAWCEGRTGFPIVDAGMRELNTTGFMHNRVRMIVASFLVKDLHIDWRWGEKYFAQKLVDYDPAVNNGNWQWAASTGCDHQPYFRIFNPWLQQKRFDPKGAYIKAWIPELGACSLQKIHAREAEKGEISGYPEPVIDHADAVLWSKKVFREASRRGKKY